MASLGHNELNSQKTYILKRGESIVIILEKIDCFVTVPHCIYIHLKHIEYPNPIYLALLEFPLFNIGCWQVQLGALSTTQAITSITGNLFRPKGPQLFVGLVKKKNHIISIPNTGSETGKNI